MSAEEVLSTEASRGLQVSVVGIGGAGNNLLSQAICEGMNPEHCVAVNTDRGQLSESPAPNKVLLADNLPQRSRSIGHDFDGAESLAHRVTPFTRHSDFTILLTGLGGVTGTRTAPVIAQLNRNRVRPVVSVVALPFIHERERRFVALRGLKRMVEACDCTIIVDNAVQKKNALRDFERTADETAALAVRGLSDLAAMGSTSVNEKIMKILSMGRVATVSTAFVSNEKTIQSAVLDALRTPSANLPVADAKGAVMLFHGMGELGKGQAVRAYEALASIIGHHVEFLPVSLNTKARPTVSIYLTGYEYGTALGAFADLIQGLYDMEFGFEPSSSEIGLPLGLYQMETP